MGSNEGYVVAHTRVNDVWWDQAWAALPGLDLEMSTLGSLCRERRLPKPQTPSREIGSTRNYSWKMHVL